MANAGDITTVEIGTPGPPGAGITASQYNSLLSRLAALEAGTAGGVTVQDEGAALATLAQALNFVGSGVTASGTGATKTVTIPGATGSGFSATEGGVTRVSNPTAVDFADADFDVTAAGTVAQVVLHGFNSAKPQYAQNFTKSAHGSADTASTTNTGTYVQAKAISWVLPAGTYTISAIAMATWTSSDSSGGVSPRLRINGTQVDSDTRFTGLDNTPSALNGDLTGVVSNGSTAISIVLDYVSATSGTSGICAKPIITGFAQRTA